MGVMGRGGGRALLAVALVVVLASSSCFVLCAAAQEDEFDEDEFASPVAPSSGKDAAGVDAPSSGKTDDGNVDAAAAARGDRLRRQQQAPGSTAKTVKQPGRASGQSDDDEEVDASFEFRVVGTPRVPIADLDEEFDDEEFEAVFVPEPDVASESGAKDVPQQRKEAGSQEEEDEDEEDTEDAANNNLKLDLAVQAKAAARVRHRPLDVADFYLEILGLLALLGYLGFYLRGRATNRELVDAIVAEVLPRMHERFAHVGDKSNELIAEAANEFVLYGTGNRRCLSFKIEFVLRRRQDALGLLLDSASGQLDQVVVSAQLDGRQVDPFVLCVVAPLHEPNLRSDNEDVAFLAKSGPKLFKTMNVLCDVPEAAQTLLSGKTLASLKSLEEYLVNLKITDQYRTQKIRKSSEWSSKDLKLEPGLNVMTMHLSMDLSKAEHRDAVVGAIKLCTELLESTTAFKLSAQGKARAKKLRDEFCAPIQKEMTRQNTQSAQERAEERKQKERERLERNPQELAKWEEKQRKKQERKQNKQGRILIK